RENRITWFMLARRGAGRRPFLRLAERSGLLGISCFSPLRGRRFAAFGRAVRYGGEGGIRTPGPSRANGFQDRRFRPLSHLSGLELVLNRFTAERSGLLGTSLCLAPS